MAVAMTVGATKIQILQQNCLTAVGGEGHHEEKASQPEAPAEEHACSS